MAKRIIIFVLLMSLVGAIMIGCTNSKQNMSSEATTESAAQLEARNISLEVQRNDGTTEQIGLVDLSRISESDTEQYEDLYYGATFTIVDTISKINGEMYYEALKTTSSIELTCGLHIETSGLESVIETLNPEDEVKVTGVLPEKLRYFSLIEEKHKGDGSYFGVTVEKR